MEILEQTRWPLSQKSLAALPVPQVFVHADHGMFDSIKADRIDFYRHLEAFAQAHGLRCTLVRRGQHDVAELVGSHHLHVLTGASPVYGRHILHACPTYVPGYWYFDEVGEREHSSLALMSFDHRTVAAPEANRFARRLRQAIVGRERTKHPQPDRAPGRLYQGSIAIFAQEIRPGMEQSVHVDLQTLVSTVIAEAGDRTVYIKPHPLQRPEQRAMLTRFHDPARKIEVVEANVFDLLEACAFTVSIGSAACFEGFLLQKPAILAGRTDFHHNALTARSREELVAHLRAIDTAEFHHNRYLTWFLRDHCLDPRLPEFPARLEDRIRRKGFIASLGARTPAP